MPNENAELNVMSVFTKGLSVDNHIKFKQERVIAVKEVKAPVTVKSVSLKAVGAAPMASVSSLAHVNASTTGNQVRYDVTALEARYSELPDKGVTWRELPIDHSKFQYAICHPEPVIKDNQVVKYNKRYGRWGKQFGDVRESDDYGVVVTEPLVLVDADDMLIAKILHQYISSNKLKCWVMRSDRGAHFWFRLPPELDYDKVGIRNAADVFTLSTLRVDYRVRGKGLACVKFNGRDRDFVYGAEFTPDDFDCLPLILYPATKINPDAHLFIGLAEGSRDDRLTSYKAALYAKQGLEVEQCADVLNFINKYLLASPLTQQEMGKFSSSASYKALKRQADSSEFRNKGKFLHEAFAQYLFDQHYFLPSDAKSFPYVYKGGYYREDEAFIQNEMRKTVPELTKNNIEEARNCLHLMAVDRQDRNPELQKEDPFWINLTNCRLNMLTGETMEHSADYRDIQRVPTTYDPEASCPEVDQVLERVFGNDEDKISLFYEIMGTCLTRDNSIFSRCFFFLGSGANGKSTVLRMIRAVVGDENISHLKPSDMVSNSFNLIELQGKLANIVEEINASDLDQTDVMKQVIGGDMLRAQRKYRDSISFVPYCTVIFATNKMPVFKDRSLGMERRFELLPFEVNFMKLKQDSPDDYDPEISRKVTTEVAKSYMLNKAIEAYRMLHERKEYTVPKSSVAAKECYLGETNSVALWLRASDIGRGEFNDKTIGVLFGEYRDYVRDEVGTSPLIRKNWKEEVTRLMADILTGKEEIRRSDNGSKLYYFEVKERWSTY